MSNSLTQQLKQLTQFRNNEEIILATAKQTIKDFQEHGYELKLAQNFNYQYDNLFNQILPIVEKQMIEDFSKLLNMLYRIDISEQELKQKLAQSEEDNSAIIITEAILERELKKIIIRFYYKNV